MRMLTEDEREWLSEEDFDNEEYTDATIELGDELQRCGRAEWRQHPFKEDWEHSYTTEWGAKALRVDAIIRGMGME